MASNANDMFQKVSRSTATTLSAPGYTIGATSINVASTSNWPADTGITFVIDEVDGNGNRINGTYNIFRGTVGSATQLANLTYVGGDANRNYSAGATTRVYILVSYARENRLVDGLLVSHNQDGTLKTDSVDSTQIKADAITTPKLASGSVTADKQTPTTWDGSMSALNPITTSYTNIASVTLPAVTSAHKYLIVASFYFNHNGGASVRDYTGAIRNGTTTLVQTTWSAMANYYINTVSGNIVFTSSSSGGETINFSVLRSTDNGGLVTANRSFYSIVDLGLA